jgi:hypothetical protein
MRRDERGITLVELLVSLAVGMIVILGILALSEVALRSSARTTARVDADQRARPVLAHLMDQLHSTCLGPSAGPILAGSTESQLAFLHQTGSDPGPTPDKRVITFADNTLIESVYPYQGGEAPDWVFADVPSNRQLLTGVSHATTGDPPAAVPVFEYFSYVDGALSPEPLTTPLTPEDAALTVQVKVSFSTSPSSNPTQDPEAAVTLTDSALVRFSPASEDPAKVNEPCV